MPVYLKDVKQELRSFGRSAKKYPVYRVSKLVTKANPITKSISFKGVVHGETDNYMVHVQFFGVDYQEAPAKGYEPIKVDDTKWYYKVPNVRKNPVHLKCSDPDFRFRFEKELYDNSGLVGNWRRYKRKTPPPPKGRPYVNPEHWMGFCEHVWSFLLNLQSQGLLKE